MCSRDIRKISTILRLNISNGINAIGITRVIPVPAFPARSSATANNGVFASLLAEKRLIYNPLVQHDPFHSRNRAKLAKARLTLYVLRLLSIRFEKSWP